MMNAGIRSHNLPSTNVIDSLLGNFGGTTHQIDLTRLIALISALIGPTYATRSQLYADLAWPAGAVGYVRGDSTSGFNGVYRKSGASGAGSWGRIGDLPSGAVEAGQIAALESQMAALSASVFTRTEISAALRDGGIVGLETVTGSGQAMVGTIPAPLLAAGWMLNPGCLIAFRPPGNSTGAAPTLTVEDSSGVYTLTLTGQGGRALAAGDLQQSSLYIVQFVANTGFDAQGRVLGALSLADINGLVEALAGKADATTLNQLVRVVQTGAAGRPGDAPEAWSGQVAGLPEAMVPVANPDVRLTADGRVLRLTGEQLVAPRWWLRLDPTRKYQVRWIYTRPADVVDPAGASVRAQMAWLDGAGSSVQGSTTINTRTPSASAGRQVVTAVIAAAAAADVNVVWPAGAAYARPWLQTYQVGSVTDLEAIEIADLTDLGGFSPDLTALQASVAALAPIPARVTALETLATGSRIARFATRAEASAAQVAANVDFIEVQSFSLTTPRVPALYERTGASAIGGFQSANGAFWKPAWQVTQLEMLGALGDGSANDQAAWAAARTLGREVYLSRSYLVTDPSNTAGIQLSGPGRLIMAVTGGHVQRNTRFDLGPVMFRSHLFAVKNKLLSRTAIRLILLGDSTVADSQIDLAAQVRAELETLGVAVAEVTNAAIAGHAWGSRNLATVLDGFAAQKDVVFLKFGINDAGGSDVPGPSDIPAKAASMNTAMRQRLSEIRASTYGALANLSIVLVLPTAMGNSADNTANDRNNLWIESIREIYVEAARDYTCAIYDPYIEARNAEGGGGRWLDDMLVHPKPNLNLDVWTRMVRDLLAPGGDIPVNRLVQRRADQGTAPLTSDGLTGIPMGVSVMRTPAGDGWPIAGTVLTVRHPDNTAIQTGYDFQYGAPRIRTRSWLTASGIWSNWDNTTEVLIMGSGLGQTGGVELPSMTRTAEGDVRLAGSVTASADIAVNAIIAYLPAGYRPGLDVIRFVHTYGNTVVRLRIKTNGQILTETPITTGTIITFGGVLFSAAGQQVAFSPANWFTAGRLGLYLEAWREMLFQDSAGTNAATTAGHPVGLARRLAGTVDASQATSAARPTLARHPRGGRRNLLLPSSEALSQWDLSSASAVDNTPGGSSVTAAAGTAQHTLISARNAGPSNSDVTITLEAKAGTETVLILQPQGATASHRWTYQANLTTGVVTSLGGAGEASNAGIASTSLADGWWRITLKTMPQTAAGVGVALRLFLRTEASWAAVGTENLQIRKVQIEYGNNATAYQNVASAADVTESGVVDIWHLADDLVDDALIATLPAATYTRAWVTSAGAVTIQAGLALSGSEDIIRAERIAAVLYINRALTPDEATALTKYWEGLYK